MTEKQPEALRLATWLEDHVGSSNGTDAAKELRRLNALNAEMLGALQECMNETATWYFESRGRDFINRSAGQHLSAMREHAEEYEQKQCFQHTGQAQAAINTVAPTAREMIYAIAERYNTAPATASEWLANAADEIANFEG